MTYKEKEGEEVITIGEVTGVHGVKGYIKIKSFAQSYSVFSSGISFFIGVYKENSGKWYKLIEANPHKKGLIALFEGVDRNIAETLIGKMLSIAKSSLPELEEDTYYWEELKGLKVTDVDVGYLGLIDHVIATGSNDVFVVKSEIESNSEILIPALSLVVISVNIDQGEMVVDLPSGLTNLK